MNVLYIGPYKGCDKWSICSYNYLGMLNSIPNINIVARNIQYNSLSHVVDDWCKKLENKECLLKYDKIIQFCLPSDFVYYPNSIGITIIEPNKLNDLFWQRKLKMMPKIIVGSNVEKNSIKYNKNVVVLPIKINTEKKYQEYKQPPIKELGKSYIFYWIGEYGEASCWKETYKAFHLEFNREDNVHLAMYFICKPNKDTVEKLLKELKQIKLSLNKYKNMDFYKKETINIGSNLNETTAYHAHLDCYVDINRGTNNWVQIKDAQLFGKQIIINRKNILEPITNHQVYSSKNLWGVIDIKEIMGKMRATYKTKNSVYNEWKDQLDKLDYQSSAKKFEEILQ